MNSRVFDARKQILTADEEEQWDEEIVEVNFEDVDDEE
jgi:hypothetical protein